MFQRFCISKVALTKSVDNIVKVIPFSYVIHSYFVLQESFTRAQLEAEKLSGSPAAVACILDLSGLNITDFINPLSISAKFARLIVKVWADYFTE
ncbi:unnamed protein product, partial [Gongylonema pulchrum]|uniref:CID domain-containing protein n=1 Tax=Gongylonema pulchrum TaxID=637853 RepID=A0A183D5D2_9BILA